MAVTLGFVALAGCGTPADDAVPAATAAPSTIPPGDDCVVKCPGNGEVMTVSFVRFDDELPLFASPALTTVVGAAEAASDVIATGDNRLGRIEVNAGGTTGWTQSRSLNWESPAQRDVTDDVIADVGTVPSAPTMLELGQLVADLFRDETDTGELTEAVPAVAPTEGTTSVVVFDVASFGDDSLYGARLRITGRQTLPATALRRVAAGYELVEVTTAALCGRGVDAASGLCV